MPPQTTGQPQWIRDRRNTLSRVSDARAVYLNRFQGHPCPSIDANDFDAFAHPIQRQVDPAGISTLLDFLFDHLLPEGPELGPGGFAGIMRLPAALFQARFCFPGDPIVICLVEHADFLSGPASADAPSLCYRISFGGRVALQRLEFVGGFTDLSEQHLSYKLTTI